MDVWLLTSDVVEDELTAAGKLYVEAMIVFEYVWLIEWFWCELYLEIGIGVEVNV